jgi:stringent starvation protein B
MTSVRPYLIRAFFQWILDNTLTPYILVNAEKPNVHIPKEHVKNGQIIFNITPGLVDKLDISNDCLQFSARFSGVKRDIYIPVSAVLAIYAKENGRGMVFDQEEEADGDGNNEPPNPETPPQKKKPKLSIVK